MHCRAFLFHFTQFFFFFFSHRNCVLFPSDDFSVSEIHFVDLCVRQLLFVAFSWSHLRFSCWPVQLSPTRSLRRLLSEKDSGGILLLLLFSIRLPTDFLCVFFHLFLFSFVCRCCLCFDFACFIFVVVIVVCYYCCGSARMRVSVIGGVLPIGHWRNLYTHAQGNFSCRHRARDNLFDVNETRI